jgi:aspartyl-tRNA(Asn)/glutamyl-tRNA(Gln) amidotransferase subunit B
VLTAERAVGIYFEAAVAAGGDPGEIANWITGPLFGAMNREAIPRDQIGTVKAGPEALAALAKLVASDKVNRSAAAKVFDVMFACGGSPEALVEEMGLAQLSDEGAIAAVVRDVIAANPDEVADYIGGKESLVQWFMGQVMRATRGKANPQIVLPLIREELEAQRNE